jgi:site-specific DNA-methyltransferase (adenine-specific)
MEFMSSLDDCFEAEGKRWEFKDVLAIVDPPYGIGENASRGGKKYGKATCMSKEYKIKNWDNKSPDKKYFQKLFRVSNNQIIWGANHFISKMPYDSSCWIVWYKLNDGNYYADCELAWSSFKSAVRIIKYAWNGMIQQNMKNKERRIHPTQKPVALYKWLLKNYARPGQLILDTHVGSGSSRIACHDLGFDFIGCELDPDYWQDQEKRFQNHIANADLFTSQEIQSLVYEQKEISCFSE